MTRKSTVNKGKFYYADLRFIMQIWVTSSLIRVCSDLQSSFSSWYRQGNIAQIVIFKINVNFPYKRATSTVFRASPMSTVSQNTPYVKEAYLRWHNLVCYTYLSMVIWQISRALWLRILVWWAPLTPRPPASVGVNPWLWGSLLQNWMLAHGRDIQCILKYNWHF